MSAPLKPWETTLQNKTQLLRNSNLLQGNSTSMRNIPPIPPRPQSMNYTSNYNSYNSHSPYSSGYGGSYNSMNMPYRSPMYGGTGYGSGYSNNYGYGGYGSGGYGSGYGGYGSNFGVRDDSESRFIQYAEESSRNAFANVESLVRAFNSMAMMLDNTFFAMTSSFRAVLSVAENVGRIKSMFGQIWHALNIFRLAKWLYRKLLYMLGRKDLAENKSLAWNEALNGAGSEVATSSGSSWPTIAFFGILLSAPYFISKLLPKYEDKLNPELWKKKGIPAKVAFDFVASAPNEISLQTNDEILLAPKMIQEELKLTNSGWAYATCNGKSGVVPLNYIVSMKRVKQEDANATNSPIFPKKIQKKVSFGENQIFEPIIDSGIDVLNSVESKDISLKSGDEITVQVENVNE